MTDVDLLGALAAEGAALPEAELPSDANLRGIVGALVKGLQRAGGVDLVDAISAPTESVIDDPAAPTAPITSRPPVPSANTVAPVADEAPQDHARVNQLEAELREARAELASRDEAADPSGAASSDDEPTPVPVVDTPALAPEQISADTAHVEPATAPSAPEQEQ